MSKYALITGASAGIGKEIAEVLAEKKYNLVLTARREDRLIDLVSELKQKYDISADYITSDLADRNAPQTLYDFCKSKNYDVEVLINNAGYGIADQFHETSVEVEEKFIAVLGTSVITLTKLFIGDMLKRETGQIMIVSSVAAFAPPSTIQVLYGPIKTFMNRSSDAINVNYKHKGISSTALCPGYTVTEFHTASGTQEQMDKVPGFLKLDARRVAREGIDAMLQRKSLCIPGKRYRFLVFMMNYFSFLIRLGSNALTGGRYKRN